MTAKGIPLIFVFIALSISVKAQDKQVTHQALYWTRYYNQISLNDKWTWHNEVDNRVFFENNKHQNLIVHSRLHYKFLKNADLAIGFTYSLQGPQDPNSKSNLIIPELRPVQELNFNSTISNRLAILQRLRIDERFIRKNNGVELLEGYNFNFRFRYRLQAAYKFQKVAAKITTTLKISDELMFNCGKNIVYNQFDQNRFYLGIEQVINKNISAELGGMYLFQKRSSGYQFFDRDIIRFTIYHKLRF